MEDMYNENNVDDSTLQKLMNTMGSLLRLIMVRMEI